MQKKSLLFLFFSFSILLVQAQTDSLPNQSRFIKSFRVTANYNHYYDSYGIYYGYYYNWKELKNEFGNIGLGYTLKSRKNFNSHDIEISNAGFDRNKSDGNYSGYKYGSNQQYLTLRYQYNYFFIKRSSALLSPYVGASYLIHVSRRRSITNSGNDLYDRHSTDFSFSDQLAVVPGLQLKLSNCAYLDLSIPINLFRGNFSQTIRKENPEYNSKNKFSDGFAFFNKEYYQVRLGLGFIINPDKKEMAKNEKYEKSFKINFYQHNYYKKNPNYTGVEVDGFTPVIAFRNVLTRNTREIELTEVRGLSEIHHNNFSFSLRYQYNYFFIKKPSMFAPYLGISVLLNSSKFYQYSYSSYNLNYYTRQNSFNYTFAAVPGIQFNPGNKFYLDLSIPLNIWEGDYYIRKTNNPSLPEHDSGFYGDFADGAHQRDIRIGLGFRL
jgi:outer membrane protein W